MGKSILKHRSWKRILALALALAMLAAYVPAAGAARAADAGTGNVHVLDAAQELAAFAAGEKAAGDTTEAGGYFTILWSEKSKVDSSSKTWDDGYSSGQRINFGGKATTAGNSVMFKTAGPATVKIWWVQGGDDNREMGILNGGGQVVAQTSGTYAKNDPYLSTLELTEAGTWYLGGVSNNNYIFKVEVTTGGGAAQRAPWTEAASPVITGARQSGGNIDVTVSALVGADGADKLTVTMTGPGGSKESKDSLAEKNEHTVSFTPSASGEYSFSVTAVRDGEETEHKGAETKTAAFSLPLAAPNVKSATNNGGGSVTVEWDPVAEAGSYKVTVDGTDKSAGTTECSATIEGLTIGETYTFQVVALRGGDTSAAGSISCAVKDKKEVTWAFVSYGPSASASKNSYSGNANDGSVTLVSTGNGGKIQNTVDGLGFYYTVIDPKTTNFTLTATVRVNSWTYSNGQEGFGLMAADIIGAHGDTGNIYNNSYMAVATKVEYTWDSENDRLSAAGGTKVSMYLGLGAREILGVTRENQSNAGNALKYTMVPLEHAGVAQGGGNFNIVGNVTNPDGLASKAATIDGLTEFKITITKNNTGYFISYTDAGGKTETKKFYDPDALSVIDEDHVYVGFFVARGADVTFADIAFTTVSPEDDAAAESRPIEYTDPATASYPRPAPPGRSISWATTATPTARSLSRTRRAPRSPRSRSRQM